MKVQIPNPDRPPQKLVLDELHREARDKTSATWETMRALMALAKARSTREQWTTRRG